jgi:hypothetical protein
MVSGENRMRPRRLGWSSWYFTFSPELDFRFRFGGSSTRTESSDSLFTAAYRNEDIHQYGLATHRKRGSYIIHFNILAFDYLL